MAEQLRGNAVVAQSGGPTAVINASACGVIQECLRQSAIADIYGANNGILGIVHEDLFDLRAESAETIEGLRRTPSAAIGSCRYKLGDLTNDRDKYQRLLDVFRAHNIRYFFYIGGNDSMDTADKLNRLAQAENYELRVMGVPKTIDNDLVATDHCPGYGSVAKFLATVVMEAGRDTEAMYTFDPVTIVEAMGRNAGWIAAAAGLARRQEEDAPHLIYVPEIPFSVERFLNDVREVHRRLGRCLVVASEGLVDEKGEYITAQTGKFATDAFGHRQLGGIADFLQRLVEQEIGIKCRYNKLGTFQRNAIHFASRTDSDEAYLCGQEAVRRAVAGTTGFMVTLVRESDRPYRCGTGLAPLAEVANGVKYLPRHYMDVAGTQITEAMRQYAGPLIVGEVPIRIGPDGLPEFVRFQRRPVPKKLPAFVGKGK
ncbi:MAG TPA: 6-phosphofructokinase [Gemmataceae bacterium]|nr:6-phosphofructokinase [Gemmataceae bacterium]